MILRDVGSKLVGTTWTDVARISHDLINYDSYRTNLPIRHRLFFNLTDFDISSNTLVVIPDVKVRGNRDRETKTMENSQETRC